jgi:hypothetical protein
MVPARLGWTSAYFDRQERFVRIYQACYAKNGPEDNPICQRQSHDRLGAPAQLIGMDYLYYRSEAAELGEGKVNDTYLDELRITLRLWQEGDETPMPQAVSRRYALRHGAILHPRFTFLIVDTPGPHGQRNLQKTGDA